MAKKMSSRRSGSIASRDNNRNNRGAIAVRARMAIPVLVLLFVFLVVLLKKAPDEYTYQGLEQFVTAKEENSNSNNDPSVSSAAADVVVSSTSSSSSTSLSSSSSKSHMLSLEPLKHSLHADWKLWEEMNSVEQDEAIKKVGPYLTKYGKMIEPNKDRREKIKHGTCELVEFASGHALCGPKPPDSCTFFSFGINDDPSFDVKLAELWNCRGFAGDPTVHHPSKLHPLVTFHNVGASMLIANEERLNDKGGTEEWWDTSMTKLRYWLGLKHVNIIKMDCEGCEFSLARDILREDPTFLYNVDQISIETHVTKSWLTTREHFYYFALHFALLEEAGFKLEWSDVFGCSKRHEVFGCVEELETYGFPCGYKPWPNHPTVVLGRSCHDFLWKRY